MTKQITKPAVRTVAKSVVKPTTKAVMKEVVKNLHIVAAIARPQSGPRLYAHTFAVLSVLGMLRKDHPAILRSTLESMIGNTAIRYHVGTTFAMEERHDRVSVTENGAAYFRERHFDKETAKAFEHLLKTGDGVSANIKPQHIAPVTVAL